MAVVPVDAAARGFWNRLWQGTVFHEILVLWLAAVIVIMMMIVTPVGHVYD